MNNLSWYILKRSTGNCEIVSTNQQLAEKDTDTLEYWGPFTSQDEALARRVGLIRAGKCQPR